MTLLSIAAAIVVVVVCIAAARRIAEAKASDREMWTMVAFLTGPLGVLGAAVEKPDDPEKDRLSWWGDSQPARAWVSLAALVVVGAVAFTIYALTRPAQGDGQALEPQITSWLEKNGVPGATVDCPSHYKVQAGYTFICTATDSTGTAHIEVVVLNDQGQVQWNLTG
jgi:membrane protease YdiL (CAAX protease family)